MIVSWQFCHNFPKDSLNEYIKRLLALYVLAPLNRLFRAQHSKMNFAKKISTILGFF